MIKIRYVEASDKEFWYSLDKHLPETEFENKVYTKRGYVLSLNNKLVGLLRYNLFWDSVPFWNATNFYAGGWKGTTFLSQIRI